MVHGFCSKNNNDRLHPDYTVSLYWSLTWHRHPDHAATDWRLTAAPQPVATQWLTRTLCRGGGGGGVDELKEQVVSTKRRTSVTEFQQFSCCSAVGEARNNAIPLFRASATGSCVEKKSAYFFVLRWLVFKCSTVSMPLKMAAPMDAMIS